MNSGTDVQHITKLFVRRTILSLQCAYMHEASVGA